MNSIDIGWIDLLLGCLVLVIPGFIFIYYKTALLRPFVLSFLRMGIQLTLVAIYLEYIFEINSLAVNLTWVIVMIFAAGFMIINRSDLKIRYFIIPVLTGIVASILINGTLIATIVIGSGDFFNARYIIPIAGMMIGNSIGATIIGIRNLFESLAKNREAYRFALMCGATNGEALFPFISNALKHAFSPTIANTASIGLIWLPGMMTGQILGGSDPTTAIKYQIMIVVTIFAGTVITLFLSILLSKKFAFNEYGNFNPDVFKRK